MQGGVKLQLQISLYSNSDDNMLKNIEQFDKLSLRFNGRVLFIKDVIGDEICCWSFYGQGRKIAEVCCTSIVYATEKKQTKVTSRKAQTGLIFTQWIQFSTSLHFQKDSVLNTSNQIPPEMFDIVQSIFNDTDISYFNFVFILCCNKAGQTTKQAWHALPQFWHALHPLFI